MQRWLSAFIAGFLAVIFFHQPLLGLLHAYAVVPVAPFSTAPTAPLGVPGWLSAGFWGGVWALALIAALRWPGTRPLPWLKGLLFGGIALTTVALLVVFPLKGRGLDMAALPGRFLIGFIVNAGWGVGTLIFAHLLLTRR